MNTVSPPPSARFTRQPPRRTKSKIVVLGVLWVTLAILALWSCGKGAYHNYRLASAAVDRFHGQLNDGDFETIFANATDEFRRTGTREAQLSFFETVHQKMGASGRMSIKGLHINWRNGILTVDQVFETQFTFGPAQEGFVWVIDHEQPRLQTYRIDSPNLR